MAEKPNLFITRWNKAGKQNDAGYHSFGSALTRLLRRGKIQNRLVASFAVLSLLPLLITGVFAYYKSSEAIKSKISTSTIQVMNQVSENIQNELKMLENDSVDIAFSDTVQDTLLTFNSMNEWEKHVAGLKLQSMLAKRYSFSNIVSDVLIYTTSKEKIIAYGDVYFKLKLKQDYLNKLFTETAYLNGVPLWTIADQSYEEHSSSSSYRKDRYGKAGILLSRAFKSIYGVSAGTIILRVDEKYILNKYKDINLGSGAEIFILNSKGTVISSRNPDMQAATVYSDRLFVEKLIKQKEKGIYSFNSTFSGESRLIAYTYIPGADWYVVSAIPLAYLNDEPVKIGLYISVLSIVCFLLALFLSYYVSKSISKPLKLLIDSMNSVKTGNLTIRREDYNRDELGVVTTNFNNMVRELEFLIDEVKHKENLKRIADLKTLQAQINPHFLSNTLNTVRSLANIQKADNISSVITSLIQLLHGCMGKGGELVTVREEVEYVRNYLNIMAYKYYDKFKLHCEVEESILDCRTLRFILQPIVENSLLHGLEPTEGQGIIIIKGYRTGDVLKFTVSDNGTGMTDGTLSNLLSGKPSNKQGGLNGIGIGNVDERIKLYFGNQYGISVQSVPHLFTTVEISFPIIEKEEKPADAKSAYYR